MKYRIEFTKSAAKEYNKLPGSRRRLIEKKIDSLAQIRDQEGAKIWRATTSSIASDLVIIGCSTK